MRIISGKYRGKRLNPPAGFSARPTTDFARESLFNILATRYDFEGLHVLDLFAGTGSIGLEFASRGASSVTMVEVNYRHYDFIRNTLSSLDLPGTKVVHTNTRTFIRGCHSKFDIIFADPPYDLEWLAEIPDLVLGSNLLNKDSVFILEHPKGTSFTGHPLFREHRNYGSVNFSLFSEEE